MKRESVYTRILQANRRSRGLRLTAKEVFMLAEDAAIASRGEQDETGIEEQITQAEYAAHDKRRGIECDEKSKRRILEAVGLDSKRDADR